MWMFQGDKPYGVSLSLMSEMKKTVTYLHERLDEVKMRNTNVILGSGYKAYGEKVYYDVRHHF